MTVKLFIVRCLSKVGIIADSFYAITTDISGEPAEINPRLLVEVTPACDSDMEELARVLGPQVTRSHREWLIAGCRCYVAKHDGRVCGCSWIEFGHATSHGRTVIPILPADTVYSFGSEVSPEQRGKGVFQMMLAEIYRDLRGRGIRRVINLVMKDNLASIKARMKFKVSARGLLLVTLPFGRRTIRVWRGSAVLPD